MIFTIKTDDEVAGIDIERALSFAGIKHQIVSKQPDTGKDDFEREWDKYKNQLYQACCDKKKSVKIFAKEIRSGESFEITDLYWFEENYVHSFDEKCGLHTFEIIADGVKFFDSSTSPTVDLPETCDRKCNGRTSEICSLCAQYKPTGIKES